MNSDDYKKLFKKRNKISFNKFKNKDEYLAGQDLPPSTKVVFFHSKDTHIYSWFNQNNWHIIKN